MKALMKRLTSSVSMRVIAVVLIAVIGVGAYQVQQTEAAIPVTVTNFNILVQTFLKVLWDGVVSELQNQFMTYLNTVLKAPGLMTAQAVAGIINGQPVTFAQLDGDIATVQGFFKQDLDFVNTPEFQKSASTMFGDQASFRQGMTGFVSAYAGNKDFLKFSDARDNPTQFMTNMKQISMYVFANPPALGEEDISKLTDAKKLSIITKDVGHSMSTEAMLTAGSGLTLAEQVSKKYESLDGSQWDGAYSDAVIKDIAKMMRDNLRIQTAQLRVLATSKLSEATK